MTEALTLEMIIQLSALFGVLVTIIMWLNRQFSKAGDSRIELERKLSEHMTELDKKLTAHVSAKVEGIESKIAGLSDKVNEVERDLLRHQRYAAESFATKDELNKSHGDVKASIDKLTERLNQVIEGKVSTRRTSTKS